MDLGFVTQVVYTINTTESTGFYRHVVLNGTRWNLFSPDRVGTSIAGAVKPRNRTCDFDSVFLTTESTGIHRDHRRPSSVNLRVLCGKSECGFAPALPPSFFASVFRHASPRLSVGANTAFHLRVSKIGADNFRVGHVGTSEFNVNETARRKIGTVKVGVPQIRALEIRSDFGKSKIGARKIDFGAISSVQLRMAKFGILPLGIGKIDNFEDRI